MHNCSKLFSAKSSKPNMSNIEILCASWVPPLCTMEFMRDTSLECETIVGWDYKQTKILTTKAHQLNSPE